MRSDTEYQALATKVQLAWLWRSRTLGDVEGRYINSINSPLSRAEQSIGLAIGFTLQYQRDREVEYAAKCRG